MHPLHPNSTPFTDGNVVGGPVTGVSRAAGICLGAAFHE
jgi:hypothetical protein